MKLRVPKKERRKSGDSRGKHILRNVLIVLSVLILMALAGTHLLKLITGELTPDAGELFITRGTSIGFLKQNSGLSAERTIFEEMRSVFSRLLFCQEQMAKLQR